MELFTNFCDFPIHRDALDLYAFVSFLFFPANVGSSERRKRTKKT